MNALSIVGGAIRAVVGTEREPSFLVAVSGGADSVALLDLLVRQTRRHKLRLGVAHVNYRLRVGDADEDALFVRDLAASYGLPFYVRTLSDEETARLGPTGVQEKARRVRYRFFDEVARREGFRFVALGHHQGDQLETFFAHLFRGAGAEGLKGMRMLSQQRYFRPLLKLTRGQVESYLKRRCLPHRVDASNASRDFLRGRLRHDLLPVIEERHGASALGKIAQSMEILASDAELLDRIAQRELPAVVRPVGKGSEVDVAALKRLPLSLQRRILRKAVTGASFAQVEELLDLALSGASGSQLDLGHGVRALRVYGKVMLGAIAAAPEPLARLELAPGARLEVPEWGVSIAVDEVPVEEVGPRAAGELHADRARVTLPLVMRLPLPGDRIAPLGLKGHHKTLARWFKDAKVPLPERATQLVMADAARLVWVVGRLVSEECRITPETRTVLRVKVVALP